MPRVEGVVNYPVLKKWVKSIFSHPTLASIWLWPSNSKTGYLRPLNYQNRSHLAIRLFWWPVSLTWTPRGSGAHLSAILSPLSSFFSPSLSSLLSLPVPLLGGHGGSGRGAVPGRARRGGGEAGHAPRRRRGPRRRVGEPAVVLLLEQTKPTAAVTRSPPCELRSSAGAASARASVEQPCKGLRRAAA